jgi:magnesium transporter
MNITLSTGTAVDAADIMAPLRGLDAADAVEFLNSLNAEGAASLMAALPKPRAVELLEQPELLHAAEIVALLPNDHAARLLDAMAADRATDIFQGMDDPVYARLMGRLAPHTRRSIESLVNYPDGTAGSLMTTEFVSVPASWTVGETLAHVRRVESSRETIYAIFVLAPRSHELQQKVTLRRLIMGEPDAPLLSVASDTPPVTVTPDTHQEEVARLIRRHDLLAIPVVDKNRQMLGIVTVDDVIDAMIEETTEDVQKFGGMQALEQPYMQIGFLPMVGKRAGWLCALFLSEMLTASAMQHFETELDKAVVLTLFIPLIMSSGGNSGSQATSLLIRGLALGEVTLRDWWRVAFRELPMGMVLGGILGIIGIARITAWQLLGLYNYGPFWPLVALTVGASLVGIVTFGSLAGSMLPFVLKKIGFDPASASAPFVATLVDVTGLVIYFSIALVILHGTML